MTKQGVSRQCRSARQYTTQAGIIEFASISACVQDAKAVNRIGDFVSVGWISDFLVEHGMFIDLQYNLMARPGHT